MAEYKYVDWPGLQYYHSKVTDLIDSRLRDCIRFGGEVLYENLESPDTPDLNIIYRVLNSFTVRPSNEWFDDTTWNNTYPAGTLLQVVQTQGGVVYKVFMQPAINGGGGGGSTPQVDLSNYYTIAEVDAKFIDALEPYATVEFVTVKLDSIQALLDTNVDDFGKLTARVTGIEETLTKSVEPALTELGAAINELADTKANVEDIPSLEGYATEEFVATAIKAIEIPDNVDLSGYAKTADVEAQISAVDGKIATKADKTDIEGLASESYVDEKFATIDIPVVPTKVSELENDSGYITELPDLSGYAKVEHKHSIIDVTDYVEPDLSDYAKKEDIPNVDLSNFYNKTEVENIVNEAVSNISIPEVPTNVSAFYNDAGYLTEVPEEYVTESALSNYYVKHEADEKIDAAIDQAIEELNLPGTLSEYATDSELKDAIDAVEYKIVTKTSQLENDEGFLTTGTLPAFVSPEDITDFVTLTEVEEAGFIKSIPEEYVTEFELNERQYVTEESLNEKGFITDVSNKADTDHTHSYNELADLPTIPSIDGLATEQYVEDALANIDIPTLDTTNLLTKEEANELLATKANDVPFADDYRVGTALGGFVADESLQGMTVVQILTKLLGLTLYVPPVADLPEGTPEQAVEVIANEYPVYILGESGEQVELTYNYVSMTPAEAKIDNQVDTFFYQIIDPETGVAVESGYQIATIYQENDYLTVYIPETVTKFHVEEYSALAGDWSTPNWSLVENSNYNLDGYIAYTVPEEYGITSGITVRLVIEE